MYIKPILQYISSIDLSQVEEYNTLNVTLSIDKCNKPAMDSQLEFSSQAFSKMIMHTMKHASSSICSGLLLSPRPKSDEEHEQEAHEGGDDASDDGQQQQSTKTIRIIDAIPISHTSHYIASINEIALNAVSIYAQEQELVISGYYQTELRDPQSCANHFAMRVAEKISETYHNAVLCFVGLDSGGQTLLDLMHLIDGKWRRRPPHSYTVENEQDVLASNVLYTHEKLYRQIVDFDDHFDNIALDWTNAEIGRRIDYLVTNIY